MYNITIAILVAVLGFVAATTGYEAGKHVRDRARAQADAGGWTIVRVHMATTIALSVEMVSLAIDRNPQAFGVAAPDSETNPKGPT